MDACLKAGAHYLDTANYEPIDEAKFEYHWQWAYQDKFAEAGLMALLGSGFDPGVTNVFTAYTKKHHIAQMKTLDILDCNGGDHGQHFAPISIQRSISGSYRPSASLAGWQLG